MKLTVRRTNISDEGAMDKLKDRKIIFDLMGEKVTKMFLVYNGIIRKDLEKQKKEGSW